MLLDLSGWCGEWWRSCQSFTIRQIWQAPLRARRRAEGNARPTCTSTSIHERFERTAQGYHRLRCGRFSEQFDERSTDVLNKAQYPIITPI
jgi:hypothetical protein